MHRRRHNVDEVLTGINAKNIADIRSTTDYHLVSNYTYKMEIKSDFSTITGISMSGSAGKYASLNINPDNYALTFSPLTIVDNDLVEKKFKKIITFNFSGTLNSDNTFDITKWRNLTGSVSYTGLLKTGYFNSPGAKPTTEAYEKLYAELKQQFLDQFDKTKTSTITALNNPQFAKDDDLKQAYSDSLAKYEKLLTNDKVNAKYFFWYKLAANYASFDNVNYIITGNTTTYNSPVNTYYYTPSFNLSLNYLIANKTGTNFFFTPWVQFGSKDYFADVYSSSTWNKNQKLTDSTLLQTDTKSVYQTSSGPTSSKWLVDYGAEIVTLFSPSSYFSLGPDLSFAQKGLIGNINGQDRGVLADNSYGLVFVFKDNTGTSNINIEIYYENKSYSHYSMDDSHFIGLKFSLPFSKLY